MENSRVTWLFYRFNEAGIKEHLKYGQLHTICKNVVTD